MSNGSPPPIVNGVCRNNMIRLIDVIVLEMVIHGWLNFRIVNYYLDLN